MAAEMAAPADVSAVLCPDLALRHAETSSRSAEAQAKPTPIPGTFFRSPDWSSLRCAPRTPIRASSYPSIQRAQ